VPPTAPKPGDEEPPQQPEPPPRPNPQPAPQPSEPPKGEPSTNLDHYETKTDWKAVGKDLLLPITSIASLVGTQARNSQARAVGGTFTLFGMDFFAARAIVVTGAVGATAGTLWGVWTLNQAVYQHTTVTYRP
jgi:hypothetical protein